MTSVDLIPTNSSPEPDAGMTAALDLASAARVLDLEDWIVGRLRHPYSETRFNMQILRDSGEPFTCPVLHVAHNTTLGRGCGAIDFAADAFVGSLVGRAMHSTWQHALLGLPFGGAATAVLCDPPQLSERELHRITIELQNLRFPKDSILTPGAGTNTSLMGWLASPDEKNGVTVAGKPAALRGVDTAAIEAHAVVELIGASLLRKYESLKGQRVAVQGFDEVGERIVSQVHQAGALVVGVADISCGLMDPLGMQPHSLHEHLKREGVLLGYASAESVSNEEVLECDCDVLVLAAGADQITTANCDRIKTPMIVEACWGAVRLEAENRLSARDITVIPDALGTGGLPLAAAIELNERESSLKNTRQVAFVRRAIRKAERAVYDAAKGWELPSREAAITLGVARVAAAIRAYGR